MTTNIEALFLLNSLFLEQKESEKIRKKNQNEVIDERPLTWTRQLTPQIIIYSKHFLTLYRLDKTV